MLVSFPFSFLRYIEGVGRLNFQGEGDEIANFVVISEPELNKFGMTFRTRRQDGGKAGRMRRPHNLPTANMAPLG